MVDKEIKAIKERFLKFFLSVKGPMETPCWKWTGAVDKDGYGKFRVGDRIERVPKVSYALWKNKGEIIRDKVHRHKCDNMWCGNPLHIELGTHKDNMNDMRVRGRAKAPNKIFTDQALVERIRRSHLEDPKNFSVTKLAKRYNVSPSTISMLLSGGSYKLDLDQIGVEL